MTITLEEEVILLDSGYVSAHLDRSKFHVLEMARTVTGVRSELSEFVRREENRAREAVKPVKRDLDEAVRALASKEYEEVAWYVDCEEEERRIAHNPFVSRLLYLGMAEPLTVKFPQKNYGKVARKFRDLMEAYCEVIHVLGLEMNVGVRQATIRKKRARKQGRVIQLGSQTDYKDHFLQFERTDDTLGVKVLRELELERIRAGSQEYQNAVGAIRYWQKKGGKVLTVAPDPFVVELGKVLGKAVAREVYHEHYPGERLENIGAGRFMTEVNDRVFTRFQRRFEAFGRESTKLLERSISVAQSEFPKFNGSRETI